MKILITGASSGIGAALAVEFAKQYGKSLVVGLVGRRLPALQTLQAQLENEFQVSCETYTLDVRDKEAMKNAAQDFMQKFGAPNIVIASAGVSRGTLTEFAEDTAAFQVVMETNVMGMVHTFQPFIEGMKAQASANQPAQLVGIASCAGIRGLPGAGAYSASKAAAISYLESLRVEMLHFGIAVTTIAPGYIRTPMTDVNQYAMPFLMDVDKAAIQFVHAIKAKRRFIIIPWQMGIVARIMRMIPPIIWDKIVLNAPQKKRFED
jgi:short-subunit dehydrogenase